MMLVTTRVPLVVSTPWVGAGDPQPLPMRTPTPMTELADFFVAVLTSDKLLEPWGCCQKARRERDLALRTSGFRSI